MTLQKSLPENRGELKERVAVLESQHKGIVGDVAALKKSMDSVKTDVTVLVATGKMIKWMIGISIPVIPIVAAVVHRVLDTL